MKILGLCGCFLVSVLGLKAAFGQVDQSGPGMVRGTVFWDMNQNRVKEWYEPGLARVSVSNGREVVQTDLKGRYTLPAYDEMNVFISLSAGFSSPLNQYNIPQFFYIHQPHGSLPEIQQFEGLVPTGQLSTSVDFALHRDDHRARHPLRHDKGGFRAVMVGDTQVYSHTEIGYLRDSLVKEVAGSQADFVIAMGDNIGDDLSLYPRYLSVMQH